jgi:hypothetical protein
LWKEIKNTAYLHIVANERRRKKRKLKMIMTFLVLQWIFTNICLAKLRGWILT